MGSDFSKDTREGQGPFWYVFAARSGSRYRSEGQLPCAPEYGENSLTASSGCAGPRQVTAPTMGEAGMEIWATVVEQASLGQHKQQLWLARALQPCRKHQFCLNRLNVLSQPLLTGRMQL